MCYFLGACPYCSKCYSFNYCPYKIRYQCSCIKFKDGKSICNKKDTEDCPFECKNLYHK